MSAAEKAIYAPLPQTKRGYPYFMGYHPKHKTILFTCGNAVIIRSLTSNTANDMYFQHGCQVTCAKYSPSGYYIASGDVRGNVRVWDTTQKEHPLKLECHPLSGAISDLAWSGDNARIVCCGEGKERFGAVFMSDAGSSVGEISGHTKPLVSCDMRAARPFRVATCGEDSQIGWFEGPPFKFKKSMRDHERMVTCARFSPDGAYLATCAQDKKLTIYDGKTGEKIAQHTGFHKGSIYGISWFGDSKTILTCSADKTAAIVDAISGEVKTTFTFGGAKPALTDQQLGCLWTNEGLLSVNLDGEISVLDPEAPATPKRVITGHNKAITALAVDAANGLFFSGSYDGRVVRWEAESGENKRMGGTSQHTNEVSHLAVQASTKTLVSGGYDNTVRFTSLADGEFVCGPSVATDAPVVGLGVHADSDLVVAASKSTVYIIHGQKIAASMPLAFTATCLAMKADASEVAIGGTDKKIHIFRLAGDKLEETGVCEEGIRGELTSVAYSPDGAHLASADVSRNIFVWDVAAHKIVIQGWIFHTARVNALAWSPDSKHLVSGGVDSAVYVWSVDEPGKRVQIHGAHPGGVSCVAWLDNTTALTTGQDCAVKSWTITY